HKADQATLAITAPGDATFGHADYEITTTGGSGSGAISGAVTTSSDWMVVQSTLQRVRGAGPCQYTAAPNEADDYYAAQQAQVPGSITYGSTGTASTTGGSGTGAVTFSAGTSTGCSVNPSTGLISVSNASGTCSISASKAGDNDYNGPVTDGPKSVTLNKANQ